ncbi:zf-H2C2-2 domain containing protein [Pyrenophora tritici-repentis]|nr:Zn-finger [Pyrenophora tritici-repentis]PZD04229.1 zf-H2C2-2 domain containing protein [Pyrenophora tritici-repentis]PZD37820.1 zf-H2C2-2 domain containing protein [Pyrenophora tritici-repentis]
MAMHLASMVHGSVRERDAFQHTQHPAYYQQPQSRYPMSGVAASSYPRPQSPPSPPAEEKKPSLPSISSLLEFAGNEKPASETASHSPQSQHRQSASPQLRQAQQGGSTAMQQPAQPQTSRQEQFTSYAPASAPNSTRMTLPPTPPMHPDMAHDGNQSPSAASSHSATSTPYFIGGSLNNMEPHQQRQSFSSMPPLKRDSLQSHSMSPYSNSVYGQSPYQSSPGAISSASFYSPEQHSYNSPAAYAQRPLPSNFQPHTMPLPVPVPSPAANGSNPWQHHHYISTSSQSQFPQSQDRYICSTCNKAFSRPSSLRIHSHSHTGEKPYKCPQPGCGKAFSVRSNMKRHERGCHAASSTTLST